MWKKNALLGVKLLNHTTVMPLLVTKAFLNSVACANAFAAPSHTHQIHLPSTADLAETCYHGDAATPLASTAASSALAAQLWDVSRTTVHSAAMTS